MRCSLLLPVLALLVALTPARADVRVHGLIPGTQHSPSVAMGQERTYILSYSREDTTVAADFLRLALSLNGGEGYQNLMLPGLPSDWYWRPDAQIAFDETTGQLWMLGDARTVGLPGPQAGVYITNGHIQAGGGISWREPVQLFVYQGSTFVIPALALAVGDGTGVAHVLYTRYFDGGIQRPRLYRVEPDLGSFTAQDIVVTNPVGRYFTSPAMAAGPNGMVVVGWATGSTATLDLPADFVTRTSHDSGTSFGPEEFVGQIHPMGNPPGTANVLIQLPTLLIAKHASDFPETRLAFWGSPYFSGPQLDPSEVFFNSDCCEGSAWNSPGTMLPRQPYSWEVQPAVTMADDGYIYLGWHDFQPFDPDSVSRFMVTRLWNMGATSAQPVPLASATFDWDNVVPTTTGVGWQSGAAAANGRVGFAWMDHRGADADTYARSFRTRGFELTEGCGDTLEVTAGQSVQVQWRIANWNELFADQYDFGVGSNRPWTDGIEWSTVGIPADSYADVSFTITVPDTAADALVTLYPTAMDAVRSHSCTMYLRVQSLVAVDPGAGAALALSAPRPNPSAGTTSIAFTLPAEAEVDLAVYDLRGRRVATLARGALGPGAHDARWNDAKAPAGIYFVRLGVRADGAYLTREQRLVVLR